MLRVSVIAHPGSSAERVEVVDGSTLAVWVRQKPVEGQANAAIERAVAAVLHLRPRQVKVVGGMSGRRKILQVDLPGPEALRERLVAYGLRSDPA